MIDGVKMRRFVRTVRNICATGGVVAVLGAGLSAQTPVRPAPAPPAKAGELVPPADYVIGADDVLSVQVWDEEKMSAKVVVRPDGKITLPLMNDIQAAGLTPEQLRASVTEAALKFKEGANVMVRVEEIKSRFVTIGGEVAKQGPVPIVAPMTVLQLIYAAGGLSEFANAKKILIIRTEGGRQQTFQFNYTDVSKGKNLTQNILLKPGDTVVVP
jgi:polysaccharide biosynthesis/export protein